MGQFQNPLEMKNTGFFKYMDERSPKQKMDVWHMTWETLHTKMVGGESNWEEFRERLDLWE